MHIAQARSGVHATISRLDEVLAEFHEAIEEIETHFREDSVLRALVIGDVRRLTEQLQQRLALSRLEYSAEWGSWAL